MKLEGKRVIVIGSTMGIGLEIVQLLLEANVQVLVGSRDPKRVRSTVSMLRKPGKGKGPGKVCDMRVGRQVNTLIRNCVKAF